MADQEKILSRIRHLRELTTARGCTEAEAMAAAEKMAKLMAEYGISETDVNFEEQSSLSAHGSQSPKALVWGVVARCTNTAAICGYDYEKRRDMITFIGTAPGPEIAVYLKELCARAIDKEIRLFKASSFYKRRRTNITRRAAATDFTQSLVARLCRRLLELFQLTMSDPQLEAATAARDEMFPNSVQAKARHRRARFYEASDAGRRAGDKIKLNHGVNGQKQTHAIEGRL